MKKIATAFALTLLFTAAHSNLSAQVVLSGTSYVQKFDDLGSALPPGWSVRTNATATSLGAEAPFNTNSTSWSSTAGQFANYASTVSNSGTNFVGTGESTAVQAACTNRCPGVRLTGSFGDPGAAFVLHLQNTLGFANLQLTVDLNMLSVQTRSNLWIIDYGFGINPGSFTPVWTNTDPGAFGATTTTIALGSALNNQAQNVWIRIVTLEPAAGSGSRDTFGIDNFKLNYEAAGTVSPIPLNIQLNGTNAVLTWTNPAFALQAAPQPTGVYTGILGATSPHTNPATDAQRFFRLRAN
jgi:hypothetical protein